MPAHGNVLTAEECPGAELAGGVAATATAAIGDGNAAFKNAKTAAEHEKKVGTPKLAKLKKQHAAHVLAVVRSAEKQEAERQKKLRHATSKGNLAYLQKRFNAERRHDQTQITRLLQDADAIETAILKAAARPRPEQHQTKQHCSTTDDARHQNGSWFGGDGASAEARGAGPEGGGGGGGAVRGSSSAGLNGYADGGPKQDAGVVSLEQVRFMEQLYKHVDDQKAVRAQARLVTQIEKANLPNRTRQVRGRGGGGGGGGPNKRGHYSREGSTPVHGERTCPLGTTTRGSNGRGIGVMMIEGGGSNTGSSSGAGRRRLLEQKRGILAELKGVVSRQAQALDRLVERCGPVSNNSSGDGLTSTRASSSSLPSGRIFRGAAFGSKPVTRSSRRSGANNGDNNSTSHGRNTTISAASLNSSSTLSQSARDPPRRRTEQQDPTSAFLAHGGRWGAGAAPAAVSLRRRSVASSASYATYAERSSGLRRGSMLGVCRRPGGMPALPIGTG